MVHIHTKIFCYSLSLNRQMWAPSWFRSTPTKNCLFTHRTWSTFTDAIVFLTYRLICKPSLYLIFHARIFGSKLFSVTQLNKTYRFFPHSYKGTSETKLLQRERLSFSVPFTWEQYYSWEWKPGTMKGEKTCPCMCKKFPCFFCVYSYVWCHWRLWKDVIWSMR